MNWFYALNGQRAGPVEESEFERLVQAGTITGSTLVWHSGLSNWYPYSATRVASPAAPAPVFVGAEPSSVARAASPAIPGPGQIRCSECAQVFASDEVVRIEGLHVCADCKPLLIQKLREGIRPAGAGLLYAGFQVRFGAVFVDGLVLLVILWIVGLATIPVFASLARDSEISILVSWMIIGVYFLIGLSYEALSITYYGATLGKIVCGLKVVRPDGSRVSFGRAVARYFSKYLSAIIFAFGFIMAAFDSEKRSLHDQLCDTRVIRK